MNTTNPNGSGHVVYSNHNGVVVDTGHGLRNYRVFHKSLGGGFWAYSTFKGAMRALRD